MFDTCSHVAESGEKLENIAPLLADGSGITEIALKKHYISKLERIFLLRMQANIIEKKRHLKTLFTIIIKLGIGILIGNIKKSYELKHCISGKNSINKVSKTDENTLIISHWLLKTETIRGINLWCEKEKIDQGRAYLENQNINISDCFFTRSSEYSGYGGVIFISGGSYSMKVNFSIFYNCSCSERGGAIYFSSSNSYLRMICANRCSTPSYFHFACLQTSQKNIVEFLSVTHCSHITSGYYSVYLVSGHQRLDSINSSMNNAEKASSFWIYTPSSITSLYCTFSNNKVSQYICMGFYSEVGAVSMSYANIVNNNSPSDYGVVYAIGEGMKILMYSIFQNNSDYLFCVYSGSLEVVHSLISHSSSFSFLSAVSTTNNSNTNTMTYEIQFFKSYYCNAELPVPVPSPMRTLTEMPTPSPSKIRSATFAPTPCITFEKSAINSVEATIRRTNEVSIKMTYERTIEQTMEGTPINSIGETMKETPKDTIPRSYDEKKCTKQMGTRGEIYVIFTFLILSLID